MVSDPTPPTPYRPLRPYSPSGIFSANGLSSIERIRHKYPGVPFSFEHRDDVVTQDEEEPPVVIPVPSVPAMNPNLPPCRNLARDSWCTSFIDARGRNFCINNFFFRRWQCCAACAKEMYNASPDDRGIVSKDPSDFIRSLQMDCNSTF